MRFESKRLIRHNLATTSPICSVVADFVTSAAAADDDVGESGFVPGASTFLPVDDVVFLPRNRARLIAIGIGEVSRQIAVGHGTR